ncbi:glycerate kinase family protein [Gordonia hydrophobica]|uniref:glycerate kinase family protein n=1 Tax=Gordonia hydrophobica TaxID=40516 RepID=UPI000824E833
MQTVVRQVAQRVVIAPDEFGGTLTAPEAAQAIADGWLRACPDAEVRLLPQSDGGPGFVDVLAAAGIGRLVPVAAVGPLGGPVAGNLLLDEDTVYLESAQFCGLHLIAAPGPDSRTAWEASTDGLGMALDAAVAAGARRIVVGLGGSATTDGGRGACEALGGWDRTRERLRGVDLVAATDVTNPLLGPTGAAAVFGPQKGADPQTVRRLEERLAAWAATMAHDGPPIVHEAGAGAAGGLGAFLLALGGRRRAGAAVVAEATRRAEQIAAADVVVTGEGRYDAQTAFGKVAAAVAADAATAGVDVLVIAGQVTDDADIPGVVAVHSMTAYAGSVQQAMKRPRSVLTQVAESVAREWDSTRGKVEGGMRE